MDLDLAEFAINQAQKNGASYADARLEQNNANGFLLKNGIPQISGFDRSTGIGIRFVVKDTLGFVSSNDLEKAKISSIIESAIAKTRRASTMGEKVEFSEEKAETDDYEVKQKVNLDDVSPKEKLGILQSIEKEVVNSKANVIGRYFHLSDVKTKKYFVNTEGSKILSTIPRTNFFYFVTLDTDGKSSQRYWQYGASGGFETITDRNLPNLMKEEVEKMDFISKTGVSPPTGKTDVVLGPQVVGIICHESTGHPYEADRIYGREAAQAGESFLTADMIGTQIGSDAVNLVDDPTVPGSYGYYLYDDGGVKARRKNLIQHGKIGEFLTNRETASRLGTKSNGSARCSAYDREPIVRMSNTFMLPGEYEDEELFEDVKEGVYIKDFTEWNIDDKRVNQKYVGSEAYMIRNGEIAEPLIRPTIELSTFSLYKSIDALGKKVEYHSGDCGKGEPMQGAPVWFGGPHIRLRQIELGK